ncbi:MAG: hypothetical protein Q9161_005984 [Pseudevernia consocians]
MMPMFDELKAHRHEAHELRQDPAIDTMNRQMHTLNEDTDRFYANIGPRPQFISSALAKGGSQEANMSFERMMRAMTSASVPMMPCEVNPELNPAVEAFTPSDSSDNGPVKSVNMQASTLSKDELKPSFITKPSTADESVLPHLRLFPKILTQKESVITGLSTADKSILPHLRLSTKILTQKKPVTTGLSTADDSMADKSVPPHLRLFSKISIQKDPATTTKELSVKNKIKDHETVATSTEDELTKEAKQLEATPVTSNVLPHLRYLNNVIKNKDTDQSQMQRPDKGIILISIKDAPVKTKTATPSEIDRAASDHLTYRHLTVKDEDATPGHDVSAKITSEKENNAAFVLKYDKIISAVSEKYGKSSRKRLATPKYQIDPIKFGRVKQSYVPLKPTGTHELGSLLDDECYGMVIKPRKGVKMADIGQWQAVIKDGKVVYVLCEKKT